MKSITKLSVVLLAAAVLTAGAAQVPSDTPGTTNTSPAAPRARRVPHFQGTIASVDTATMTLTLKGKAEAPQTKIKVTSTTKIFKDRDPGTFADAAVGLRVSGSGKKDADGVWEASTLHITTTPAPKPAPSPGGPSSKQE
jgi:hypothetical protein